METGLSRLLRTGLLLAAVTAMFAGCGSVQDADVRASENLAAAFGGVCQDGTSALGEVYEPTNSAQLMTEQARGLVSATLRPDLLGAVPARGGIELRLQLPRSLMETNTASTGEIHLQIKDQWTGQLDSEKKTIPPYPVSLSRVVSASRNLFGSYEVVFADSYGSLTLIFTSTGRTLTGTLSYRNLVHAGGGAPAQGTLGAFTVPACGVFN